MIPDCKALCERRRQCVRPGGFHAVDFGDLKSLLAAGKQGRSAPGSDFSMSPEG